MIKEFLNVVDTKFKQVDKNAQDIITVDRDNKMQRDQIEELMAVVNQQNATVLALNKKITELEAELENFNKRYLNV